MELLPKALGTRPRLAVEVRAEGVVAARAEDAAGLLVAVSRAEMDEGGLAPGLKAGNVMDRAGSDVRRSARHWIGSGEGWIGLGMSR